MDCEQFYVMFRTPPRKSEKSKTPPVAMLHFPHCPRSALSHRINQHLGGRRGGQGRGGLSSDTFRVDMANHRTKHRTEKMVCNLCCVVCSSRVVTLVMVMVLRIAVGCPTLPSSRGCRTQHNVRQHIVLEASAPSV